MILNLLPPEYKQQLAQTRLWREWRRAALLVAAVMLLSLGGLIGLERYLRQRHDQLTLDINQLQQKSSTTQTGTITDVTTKLNSTIAVLTKISTTRTSWAADITAVAALAPEGIILQTLSLTNTGTVIIEGVATTRLSFIAFDEALQKSPFLTDVKTTSTPSKRENIPFIYSAVMIQPDSL